jgi:hypothetical protein
MSNRKKDPLPERTFDSFIKEGRIVMITRHEDEFGDNIKKEIPISKERAKEIIFDLQNAIDKI